jgi:hypothetical protein
MLYYIFLVNAQNCKNTNMWATPGLLARYINSERQRGQLEE